MLGEYEDAPDGYIELPEISDLQDELIDENINEQVANPFQTEINFVEVFEDNCIKTLNEYNNDTDVSNRINHMKKDFFMKVLAMIDKRYGLDLDYDVLAGKSFEYIQDLTEAIYEFFITKYPKNIKKFFTNYILEHKSQIGDLFENEKHKKDVSSIALRRKYEDGNVALILANLTEVIAYIRDLKLQTLDIMDEFNSERSDVYIITEAIQEFVITGDFVDKFMEPLFTDKQDEYYDSLIIGIQNSIGKKSKKAERNRSDIDDGTTTED